MEGEELIVNDDGAMYDVLYNVTMLEEGIVSLGAAADLITDVTCYNDTMNIEFKEIPSPDQLELIFPEGAMVVFDGNTLQDMECKLGLEAQYQDDDPEVNSSFLLVAGVEADGKTVIVTGVPSNFHYMFEEQDLLFQPVQARRNLRLGEFNVDETYDGSFQIPEGDDEKIQLTAYGKIDIEASSRGLRMNIKLKKPKCKRRGFWGRLRCLFNYQLVVDGDYTAGFDLSAYLKASFVAKDALELLNGEKRYPFLSFPIVGMGFKFPKVVHRFIKKVIPGFKREYYLGVKCDVPAMLKYGLDVDYDVEVKGEASIETGKKEVAWKLYGVLFKDLDSSFNVNELEPSKSSNIKFDTNYDARFDIKIDGIVSGGLEPQIMVDVIGLATAGVGLFTGFDLEAKFDTELMEPVISESSFPFIINCDYCHPLQAFFEATAKDAFFRTKLIGQEAKNTLLFGDWSLDFLIAKLCMLGNEERTCNNSCCGSEEVCVVDAISSEKSCCNSEAVGAQCCQDQDCGDAYYCDGNQQCVLRNCDVTTSPGIECCSSSDCNSGTELCVANFCIEQGNPGFALSWCGEDDLDIHVITPGGFEIDYRNPVDASSGGNLDKDDIPQATACWVENIVFPNGAPKGVYGFYVDSYTQRLGADNWTVRVYLGDEEKSIQSGTGDSERFVYVLE
mmetsp:Transcript_42161/g.101758  ORF Transcript_42161/g.101758 Transcript_42161/m.101758 type:complete len:673 (-) Transcript_42161:284-2302(-)